MEREGFTRRVHDTSSQPKALATAI